MAAAQAIGHLVTTRSAFRAATLLEAYFRPRTPLGAGSKTGSQITQLSLFRVRPCPQCARQARAEEDWFAARDNWAIRNPGLIDYGELVPYPGLLGDCRRCKGTGFVEGRARSKELTRRPTGSSKTGIMPRPPANLVEAADASVVMRRVYRSERLHGDALQTYHGDAGDYAEQNCGARLLALVTLTPTYRMIEPQLRPEQRAAKRRAKAKEESRETPRTAGEDLLLELKAWRTSLDEERAALWMAAESEAQSLLFMATETWERCCDG